MNERRRALTDTRPDIIQSEAARQQGWRSNMKRVLDFILSDRFSEIIYLATLCIWIAFCIFEMSYLAVPILNMHPDPNAFLRHRILILIGFCELVQIYKGNYGRREAMLLLPLALMLWPLFEQSEWSLFYSLLIIFTGRTVSPRKLLTYAGGTLAVSACVVIACSQIGVIDDTIITQGSRARHCLGFTYCLFPAQYLFSAICIWCVLRAKRLSPVEFIAMIVLNIVMFVLTDSRLSFGLGLVLVAVTIIHRYSVRAQAGMKRFAKPLAWSFAAAAAFSIAVALLYTPLSAAMPDVMSALNNALGGRLSLSANGIATYGIKAFGQPVHWVGSGLDIYGNVSQSALYNYVDNLFVKNLLQFGWIYLLCFTALLCGTGRFAWKTGGSLLAVVLLVVALHCLLDDLMGFLWFNPLLLLMTAGASQEGSFRSIDLHANND